MQNPLSLLPAAQRVITGCKTGTFTRTAYWMACKCLTADAALVCSGRMQRTSSTSTFYTAASTSHAVATRCMGKYGSSSGCAIPGMADELPRNAGIDRGKRTCPRMQLLHTQPDKPRLFTAAPVRCYCAAACLAAPTAGTASEGPTTFIEWPLPTQAGTCMVLHDFLTKDECNSYIDLAEGRGFGSAESDYPPSYRNNDRLVFDDADMAARFEQRLRKACQNGDNASSKEMRSVLSPSGWELAGVNEKVRFCRYRAGQTFFIHQDGVFHRDDACESKLTLLLYLSDGSAFEGGDTVFYACGPGKMENGKTGISPEIARVRPRAGTLILFDHALWHAGDTVTKGVKHILRSDVLFRRKNLPFSALERGPFQPSHRGYVWTMAALSSSMFASGGRDTHIRLWSAKGGSVFVLKGHTQSVLGLAALSDSMLASVSRDRTLRIWDIGKRSCMHVVQAHESAVLSVAVLPSLRIATGAADHTIKLWSAPYQAPVATLEGHTGWVWSVAAVGNDLLLSVSEDGNVKLWDTDTYTCTDTQDLGIPLRTVAYCAESGLVAVGDSVGNVTLWKLADGKFQSKIHTIAAHTASTRRVRFLDANTLASAGEDNFVRVWSLADWTMVKEIAHDNFATDVLAMGSHRIMTCAYDGKICESATRMSELQ